MKKLHAIVYAWPGQGHLNPVLRFSELLVLQGCKVTFVHSHFNLDRITKAAALHPNAHNTHLLNFLGIDDGLPDGHPRDLPSLIHATDGVHASLCISLDELVGRLVRADAEVHDDDGPPITFMVSDFFMTFTQDVANKYDIPRVGVFVQSAASFAAHVAVTNGFRYKPGDKYLGCLEGVLPSTTRPNEMISFLQCYDPSDAIFDYMIRSFTRLSEPAWVILNTFDELEHEAIDYIRKTATQIKHLQCGGPLMPLSFFENTRDSSSSMWEEDHDCLKWLDSRAASSVLFVSFGSLATLTAEEAMEFALGLEDSMVPFLWVMRPGLIEGEGKLPEEYKERVKERSCFVRWAPQTRVLTHRAIGGFLTHCGWNSVIESIAAGVPMLGWAAFADQMMNSRCIEDSWGVGLSLSVASEEEEKGGKEQNGIIKRHHLATKVKQLMFEVLPKVKNKCESLKEAAFKNAQARDSLLITPLLESLLKLSPS